MKKISIVILFLLLASCKQQQPDWSGVITFIPSGPATLTADGYDTLRVTAHISPEADVDKRSITFTTDLGTFTSASNSITVTADQNGNASAVIKGTTVGTATVRATVQTTFVAAKTINFVAPSATDIFTLNPQKGTVPADGITTTMISAIINKKLLITPQSIVFTTDLGTFGNGTNTTTQAADPSGNVAAYLKSSTIGAAHVSLTNNNVTQLLTVNFGQSLPDTILISAASTLSAGPANSLQVTIALKKFSGTVSPGYALTYTAIDNTGNPIGTFSNGTLSDATGAASVSYSAGNTTYQGTVRITVSLNQNPSIRSSINVLID